MSMSSVGCQPLHCLLVHWTLLHPDEVTWQEMPHTAQGLVQMSSWLLTLMRGTAGGEKSLFFQHQNMNVSSRKKFPQKGSFLASSASQKSQLPFTQESQWKIL